MDLSRTPLTRRVFTGSAATVGLLATGASAGSPLVSDTAHAATPLRQDPFTLGVACGDPWPDGFVLWTRLAPEPLADDGLGGMPRRLHVVQYEVAEDPRFRRTARRGIAVTSASRGHAVHVEVSGLRPGREYWYRFRLGRHVSPSGRALTAPRAGAMPSALAMAFASCSQYEHGFFTAYRHLADEHPDLVVHLGDYQYEYQANDYVAPSGNVRDHRGPETETLANYRQRHAQYKTDPDLQAAHAAAPWLVVFDDHEVDNNWADEIAEHPEDQPGFPERRTAAFRAYWENLPLRRSSVPRGPDLQLFRRLHWGRLATFHMLDTRQYRDDQACGDGYDDCPAADDQQRTLMGAGQERWLADGFRQSTARWDLLGQQVFFAQRDSTPTPDLRVSMDAWDGYRANRQRVTRSWLDAGVRNPVVLTGDVHSHWASEIKTDYADQHGASVGTELVCSSITSGGNGLDEPTGTHAWFGQNPHLKFYNNLRGYVRTTIRPDAMEVDFRSLSRVSEPGHAVFTRRSYTIADRDRTLHLTSDNPSVTTSLRQRGITPAEQSEDTVRRETERP